MSKAGQLELHPPEPPLVLAPFALEADLAEEFSVTRLTPSISRRRDINCATSSWLFVHPLSSIAGPGSSLRIALPFWLEPDTLALGTTLPLSDWSAVFGGTPFARSARASCQSKRADAMSRTVCTRV